LGDLQAAILVGCRRWLWRAKRVLFHLQTIERVGLVTSLSLVAASAALVIVPGRAAAVTTATALRAAVRPVPAMIDLPPTFPAASLREWSSAESAAGGDTYRPVRWRRDVTPPRPGAAVSPHQRVTFEVDGPDGQAFYTHDTWIDCMSGFSTPSAGPVRRIR
jgi:hypothetical protein